MEGGNIIQHSSYSIHNLSGPEENWIACCSLKAQETQLSFFLCFMYQHSSMCFFDKSEKHNLRQDFL